MSSFHANLPGRWARDARAAPGLARWWMGLLLFVAAVLLGACSDGGMNEVTPAPVISSQPTDAQVQQGAAARFTVVAVGTGLGYQWQRSNDGGATWTAITGATAATYALDPTTSGDDNSRFRVVVSRESLSTTSSAATLRVTAAVNPPTITVQPASVQATAGTTAQITLTAAGTDLVYQWQASSDGSTWADIAGATAATLQLGTVEQSFNGRQYRVRVSNSVGSVTSAAATLTVVEAPVLPSFALQPRSISVTAPAAAALRVETLGVPLPSHQWQRSNDGGASWANVAGATAANYTLTPTSLADSGSQFRVIATNSLGSVTSSAATLTVTPADAAVVITQQPQDLTLAAAQTATWSVVATGSPSPTYQWQISTDGGTTFANINNAVRDSYSVTVLRTDTGRLLRVVVSNSLGSVTSRAALLTVTAPPSVLAGRIWTTGQPMELGDELMPGLHASAIDDQGRTTTLFAKSDGSRVALYAVRGRPGGSTAPVFDTPVLLDAAKPFDWRRGVSLAVSPAGNAVAGWYVEEACAPGDSQSTGTCKVWYVARFLDASGVWEAPARVADMPYLPVFEARINDAGDIAGLGSGWFIDNGDLNTIAPTVYWRAAAATAFTKRVFAVTAAEVLNGSFVPTAVALDRAGNLTVVGLGTVGLTTNRDVMVYRGSITAGLGAREIVDLRGATVASVATHASPVGPVTLLWNQDNGTRTTTYAATLASASGSWTVEDLGTALGSTNTLAAQTDHGDFYWYTLNAPSCTTVRRIAGRWDSVALPATACQGSLSSQINRNGDVLLLQTTGTLGGRWATYDAGLAQVVRGFGSETSGAGLLLGFPAALSGSLLLSNSGIGALVSSNAYSVLPTPALPNGDTRGITNLWGLFLK